ncbi:MAG: hypothetical protein ACK4Z6_01285 [Candidatus Methylomirabilales bacterium]
METKKHLIAATNFLMGPTNFLILSLPPTWRLGSGISPPEVDANALFRDALWVTSGKSTHIVVDEKKKVGLELLIRVEQGVVQAAKPKGILRLHGSGTFGGHPGTYYFSEVTRGVFKKRMETVLTLSFYCDRIKRTISLEFMGRCGEADLQEILAATPHLECH